MAETSSPVFPKGRYSIASPPDLRCWAVRTKTNTCVTPPSHRAFHAEHAFLESDKSVCAGTRSLRETVDMGRVLVTRSLPAGSLDPLVDAGHEIVFVRSGEELRDAVQDVDAFVCL